MTEYYTYTAETLLSSVNDKKLINISPVMFQQFCTGIFWSVVHSWASLWNALPSQHPNQISRLEMVLIVGLRWYQ